MTTPPLTLAETEARLIVADRLQRPGESILEALDRTSHLPDRALPLLEPLLATIAALTAERDGLREAVRLLGHAVYALYNSVPGETGAEAMVWESAMESVNANPIASAALRAAQEPPQ